jgi:hypothetical protein
VFIYPFFSAVNDFFGTAILIMHLQTLNNSTFCFFSPQWVGYAFGSLLFEDELSIVECAMGYICLWFLLVARLPFFGTYRYMYVYLASYLQYYRSKFSAGFTSVNSVSVINPKAAWPGSVEITCLNEAASKYVDSCRLHVYFTEYKNNDSGADSVALLRQSQRIKRGWSATPLTA